MLRDAIYRQQSSLSGKRTTLRFFHVLRPATNELFTGPPRSRALARTRTLELWDSAQNYRATCLGIDEVVALDLQAV